MATTMYDIIMELPLLQGISRNQVSALLEKTHVEFINVEAGALLRNFNTTENSLLYIISGEVEIEWRNRSGDLSVFYRQGARSLLGASHLFGMLRNNPSAARATTLTSLMRIDKEQYLRLIQTQPVYLLNYLNYLSLRAQKPLEIMGGFKDTSPQQLLRLWVSTITPSNATGIKVRTSMAVLRKYTNLTDEALRRRLFSMQRRGLIELGKDTISIPSREKITKGSIF